MKNRLLIAVLCFTALLFLTSTAFAAEKRRVEVKAKGAAQSAEHRIALVIGNANYRIGALRNPANDARAIAAALRALDFEVDEQINLTYQEMGRAVNRFGKGIRKDSVALFYYAGHGLQVQGSNYLVPVDMEIQDEGEVQFNTVNAGQVLAKMEEAKNPVNIVILDACRDNPYARSFKRSSGSRGLAAMEAPVGSFVAYAAAPGKTAADGSGKNGLYTESLIRQIKNPGLKIEDVFKRVRTEVRSKSNGGQVPEERSSLEGDFYFAKGSMVVEETPTPSAVREPATGRLTVKSNVSGAKVYIDGVYEGDTPHTATLKPGDYAIILKKAGYPDAAENVRVEVGNAKTINIAMEAPPVAETKVGDVSRNTATEKGTATPYLQAAAQVLKVEITELKLCNSVDEKFICTENKERVFKRGNSIYVYMDVIAAGKNNGDGAKVRISYDTKIIHDDKTLLLDKAEDITHSSSSTSHMTNDRFLLKKYFTTNQADKLGKRTMTVIIIDKNINQETSKAISYELNE